MSDVTKVINGRIYYCLRCNEPLVFELRITASISAPLHDASVEHCGFMYRVMQHPLNQDASEHYLDVTAKENICYSVPSSPVGVEPDKAQPRKIDGKDYRVPPAYFPRDVRSRKPSDKPDVEGLGFTAQFQNKEPFMFSMEKIRGYAPRKELPGALSLIITGAGGLLLIWFLFFLLRLIIEAVEFGL